MSRSGVRTRVRGIWGVSALVIGAALAANCTGPSGGGSSGGGAGNQRDLLMTVDLWFDELQYDDEIVPVVSADLYDNPPASMDEGPFTHSFTLKGWVYTGGAASSPFTRTTSFQTDSRIRDFELEVHVLDPVDGSGSTLVLDTDSYKIRLSGEINIPSSGSGDTLQTYESPSPKLVSEPLGQCRWRRPAQSPPNPAFPFLVWEFRPTPF